MNGDDARSRIVNVAQRLKEANRKLDIARGEYANAREAALSLLPELGSSFTFDGIDPELHAALLQAVDEELSVVDEKSRALKGKIAKGDHSTPRRPVLVRRPED